MDWDSGNNTDRSYKNGLKGAGASLSQSGSDQISAARDQAAANSNRQTPMYHKGGTVRKTGTARLLKGEYVVPRGKVKRVRRLMKTRGMGAGRKSR